MDELDSSILDLLMENARITVKEIAKQVSLTSPAVSHRIRRMEESGVITGYTARVNPTLANNLIQAIIAIYVMPETREEFYRLMWEEGTVEECYQVTGVHNYMLRVNSKDIAALNLFVDKLQCLGQTDTQIVLATVRGGRGPGTGLEQLVLE